MSMDLSVWSEQRPELPRGLPEAERWQPPDVSSEGNWPQADLAEYSETGERELDGPWYYEAENWLIDVLICVIADHRHILEDVRARMPSAKYVAYVTLEPIGASRDGYEMLERVVRGLASEYAGVWANMDGVAFTPEEGQFF